MATKNYDIHNPTQGPRVIYDARHVSVTIMPGQTMPSIELEDKVADEFKLRKGDIVLSTASGRTKTFIKDVPPVKPEGEGGDGESGEKDHEDEISDTKKAANALIDEADETEFNEWKTKAHAVLGEKWPGGKPRKKDLIKLLKKVK